METTKIIYLLWAIAIILTIIGVTGSFLIILIAIFLANSKIKKENPNKGNMLIWSSIGIFILCGVLTLLIFMSFSGDNIISKIYCVYSETGGVFSKSCGSLLSKIL